jgi:hypothetical protein
MKEGGAARGREGGGSEGERESGVLYPMWMEQVNSCIGTFH